MKTRELAALVAAALLSAQVTNAEEPSSQEKPRNWWGYHYVQTPPTDKFTAREFSLDGFGSYVADERGFEHLFQTSIHDGTWGGGAGVNYFLWRWVGAGADVNVLDNGGNFVDSVSGSLIARLPIEKVGLAPYVFGGGGRNTDQVWEWTRHAGVGLEYRLEREVGVFVDGRYVWAEKTSDRTLLRAGLRFVF